eukprot:TRINITY_DN19557_c2_g1_i1.p1 TRINITY_DN19557_c2_g1~~TRINITY_DN19557_c2_g1_i1.p1  ORF type:complete len:476 (+),score=55.95 TRINITY_DN19557_c2_g1_i1:98-1525(+)
MGSMAELTGAHWQPGDCSGLAGYSSRRTGLKRVPCAAASLDRPWDRSPAAPVPVTGAGAGKRVRPAAPSGTWLSAAHVAAQCPAAAPRGSAAGSAVIDAGARRHHDCVRWTSDTRRDPPQGKRADTAGRAHADGLRGAAVVPAPAPASASMLSPQPLEPAPWEKGVGHPRSLGAAGIASRGPRQHPGAEASWRMHCFEGGVGALCAPATRADPECAPPSVARRGRSHPCGADATFSSALEGAAAAPMHSAPTCGAARRSATAGGATPAEPLGHFAVATLASSRRAAATAGRKTAMTVGPAPQCTRGHGPATVPVLRMQRGGVRCSNELPPWAKRPPQGCGEEDRSAAAAVAGVPPWGKPPAPYRSGRHVSGGVPRPAPTRRGLARGLSAQGRAAGALTDAPWSPAVAATARAAAAVQGSALQRSASAPITTASASGTGGAAVPASPGPTALPPPPCPTSSSTSSSSASTRAPSAQ